MERACVSQQVGHPFAYYFQATARQPGREIADALGRFQLACRFLEEDRLVGNDQNINTYWLPAYDWRKLAGQWTLKGGRWH